MSAACQDPGSAGTPPSRWGCQALGLVLGLAALLRLAAFQESLWLDELHTAWTVADGPAAIVPRAVIGNQSPLYFFLVWACTAVGGLNEAVVRFPSLVAGLLLVVAAFAMVRRWTGSDGAGLLAALLVAVDENCVYYAQEARTYALVQLAGLCQIAAFLRVLDEPSSRRRLAFGAWSAGMYYLHYTALLLLAAELLAYGGLWLWKPWHPRYRPGRLATDLAVLGLSLLPSAPQLWDIAARRAAWAQFVGQQPFRRVFAMLPLTTHVLLPLGIGAVAWALAAVRRRRGAERGAPHLRTLFVVLGCLFVPLLLAWYATERDWARLFYWRYVSVTLAVPSVVAGLAVAACPGRWPRGLCAVAVLGAVFWSLGPLAPATRHNQGWRSAVQTLCERVGDPRLPVFVRSGLIEADRLGKEDDGRLREYCLLPVLGIYRTGQEPDCLIPLPTTGPGALSAADRQRIVAAREAWFLLLARPDDAAAIREELECGWDGAAEQPRIAEHLAFGDVAVLRMEVRGRGE